MVVARLQVKAAHAAAKAAAGALRAAVAAVRGAGCSVEAATLVAACLAADSALEALGGRLLSESPEALRRLEAIAPVVVEKVAAGAEG
eukprot:9604153-Lingulodinium_polyedra.AAC.1